MFFKELPNDQKTGIVIVFMFLFFSVFYFLLNTWEGHYADKGYRLCMNHITKDQSSGYHDIIKGCVEKYADLKIETKNNY